MRSQLTAHVPYVTAEVLYRLANVVLAASALGVAALIVAAIRRRPAPRLEPLGAVFCLVFLAIGAHAAVRVWAAAPAEIQGNTVAMLIAVDWVAAAATVAFLLLHRRYSIFIESVNMKIYSVCSIFQSKVFYILCLRMANAGRGYLIQEKASGVSMEIHKLFLQYRSMLVKICR